jgi:hypothetical protein
LETDSIVDGHVQGSAWFCERLGVIYTEDDSQAANLGLYESPRESPDVHERR